MKRYFLTVPLFAVLLLSLAACGESQEERASVNTPIGPFTVQVGEPIQDSTYAAMIQTKAGRDTMQTRMFRKRMKMAKQRMPMAKGSQSRIRRQIVEGFAGRQLLTEINHRFIEMADSLNIQADTAQVNQRFRKYRNRFPNEKVYRQQLARQNITEDSLRSLLQQQVRFQKLRQHTMENVAQPTDSAVDSLRRAKAEEVRLQHILLRVPRGATPEASDSVQQRAQSLIDSLQSGADFAALAKRHSDDPGSAQRGGSLGWVSRDSNLVAPFKKAAFNLPEDQSLTSEPVKTQYGYHIIRVSDRRTGKMIDKAQARQQLISKRGQSAWKKEVEGQRDNIQATVRLNPNIVQAKLSAPKKNKENTSSRPPAS